MAARFQEPVTASRVDWTRRASCEARSARSISTMRAPVRTRALTSTDSSGAKTKSSAPALTPSRRSSSPRSPAKSST